MPTLLDRASFAVLLIALSTSATAQSVNARSSAVPESQSAAGPRSVIACASLANLRMVLKSTSDNMAAAIPIITDPRSDFGCTVLDPDLVTGIADHISLNGKDYECMVSRSTKVCQWVVAGSIGSSKKPTSPHGAPASSAGPGKSRR